MADAVGSSLGAIRTGSSSGPRPGEPRRRRRGRGRAQLGDLDGVVEVARLDDVDAVEGLLGLDERAVRHRAATLDRGGRRRGRQRLPARQGPTEREDLLDELAVGVDHRGPRLGRDVA
jgi:hypothetical protein